MCWLVFWKQKNIIAWFLTTTMEQAVEISLCGRQGVINHRHSVPILLMVCFSGLLGHQHPWYWVIIMKYLGCSYDHQYQRMLKTNKFFCNIVNFILEAVVPSVATSMVTTDNTTLSVTCLATTPLSSNFAISICVQEEPWCSNSSHTWCPTCTAFLLCEMKTDHDLFKMPFMVFIW